MTSRSNIVKVLTTAAVISALAPGAASARIPSEPASGVGGSQPQPTIEVVRMSNYSSFDWGDAGIGAAGGVGLFMLALGGSHALAGSRRSKREPAVR